MGDQLPALQVVVPLLAAPICLLLRNGRAAWLLSAAVTWATFVIALALLARVEAQGEIEASVRVELPIVVRHGHLHRRHRGGGTGTVPSA